MPPENDQPQTPTSAATVTDAPAATAPAATAPAATVPAATVPAATVPAATVPAATVPAVNVPWAGIDGTWSLGEGDAKKPWYDFIEEGPVRDLMKAKNYANPAQVAMAYWNANKVVQGAADAVVIPGEGATPEQVAAFRAKLGVPDAPEKYDLKAAEGQTYDPKMVEWVTRAAHKAGIPKAALETLVADPEVGWNKFAAGWVSEATMQVARTNDADVAKLQQTWGANFDANVAAGKRAVSGLGLDAATVDKLEAAMGFAPVMDLLAKLGSAASEGGFKGGNGGGDPSDPANMSREQAQTAIQSLIKHPGYMDRAHPEHAALVQKVHALFARV